jgi:hypothetical protein
LGLKQKKGKRGKSPYTPRNRKYEREFFAHENKNTRSAGLPNRIFTFTAVFVQRHTLGVDNGPCGLLADNHNPPAEKRSEVSLHIVVAIHPDFIVRTV